MITATHLYCCNLFLAHVQLMQLLSTMRSPSQQIPQRVHTPLVPLWYILQCSVTPPPEGVTYRWTDSIPSTYLSSTQSNLTLTIPVHHPSQGHYYCTVYNGSLVLGVGSTTISVRGELDVHIYQQTFHVLRQAWMLLYITLNVWGSLWSLVYKPHGRGSWLR